MWSRKIISHTGYPRLLEKPEFKKKIEMLTNGISVGNDVTVTTDTDEDAPRGG